MVYCFSVTLYNRIVSRCHPLPLFGEFGSSLDRDRDGVIWEAWVRLMECALQISLSHSIKHARSNNIITFCAVPFVFCQVIYPFHVSNI